MVSFCLVESLGIVESGKVKLDEEVERPTRALLCFATPQHVFGNHAAEQWWSKAIRTALPRCLGVNV